MVSTEFISKQLNKLKNINLNDNATNMNLHYFYGLYDSIMTEAYEHNIKVDGIYKEFCNTYNSMQKKYTNALLIKMKEDVKLCDRILNS